MGLIRKQIRLTILLDIIAEYILVLSLLILLGNMIGPIRSLTPTVPLVMIVYSNEYRQLPNIKHPKR